MPPRLGPRVVLPLLIAAVAATLGTVPSPARSASTAVVDTPVEAQRRAGLVDRLERLRIVDSVTEVPRLAPGGARFFRIWLRLPIDHNHPDGRRFRLRATLVHRGVERPMVVGTSGYGLYQWRYPYPNEVTGIVRGNQLDLEHRFFKPSRPADPDWAEQLTIRKSAADQHRIIRAFQRIYRKRWLSTGISKGGMTMTYHRRFYPGDVDGTVAYVAPNDADDADDVYDEFQAGVGGAPYAECRADLVAVQRRILQDRAWYRSRLADLGRFSVLGGPDRALEVAVIELYFAFWQYQHAEFECDEVPSPDASRRQVWVWGDSVLGWSFVTDRGSRPYIPYFFQAATELGAPAPYEDELADLLRYPGHDVAASFVPDWLDPLTFDPSAMADVDRWVRTKASRMLFVYGEFDPWSAEPFDCGPVGVNRQCLRRWVPEGTHGAAVNELPNDTRRAAIARIRAWAGVATTSAAIESADRRAQRTRPAPERQRPVPAG